MSKFCHHSTRSTNWAGGRAITPQKLEHSLKGRKNIVKLAKVPPFKNLMVRP